MQQGSLKASSNISLKEFDSLLLAADGLDGFLPTVSSNSTTSKVSICIILISCSCYTLHISSLGLMCVSMSLYEGALILMAGGST